VTYRPIARQRLGKHFPSRASGHNNKASITRQRISKHDSLTMEAVFPAWSLQSGYKGVFRRSSGEYSPVRDVSLLPGDELGIELSWQLQNKDEKGTRLWEESFMCDAKWDCYKLVARIRLVKTENSSACVTVNCELCRSVIALYCLQFRVVWIRCR
jgi:hypothetical protein